MTDCAPYFPAPGAQRRDAPGRDRADIAARVAAIMSALRHGVRERPLLLLCLLIVFVDQASKAVQPGSTFLVNTGGAAILPVPLGSMLWKSQTFGALCDTADTVLLLVGLRVTHRLTRTSRR